MQFDILYINRWFFFPKLYRFESCRWRHIWASQCKNSLSQMKFASPSRKFLNLILYNCGKFHLDDCNVVNMNNECKCNLFWLTYPHLRFSWKSPFPVFARKAAWWVSSERGFLSRRAKKSLYLWIWKAKTNSNLIINFWPLYKDTSGQSYVTFWLATRSKLKSTSSKSNSLKFSWHRSNYLEHTETNILRFLV